MLNQLAPFVLYFPSAAPVVSVPCLRVPVWLWTSSNQLGIGRPSDRYPIYTNTHLGTSMDEARRFPHFGLATLCGITTVSSSYPLHQASFQTLLNRPAARHPEQALWLTARLACVCLPPGSNLNMIKLFQFKFADAQRIKLRNDITHSDM